MLPPFRACSMTVEELLAGAHRLKVPGFQRSFCWGPNEAGQLLDDVLSTLDDAGEGAGDYFLGALVLLETGTEAASRGASPEAVRYDIIDGLQRLITLTILFAVLRDIADGEDQAMAEAAGHCVLAFPQRADDGNVQPRLELPSETQDFFSAFVQEPGATSAMPDDDDLPAPEARLIAVREHLMAALIAEDADRRGRLVQLLRSGCHCAVIVARTLDRAHRIFSVINDRGLPLARGDILRAEILGSVAAERREALTHQWRAAEHALGGSMEELLSHLRTIEGRARTRIIDEIRQLVERSGDAETFLTETLLPYAMVLGAIRSASAHAGMSPEADPRLRYLGWLGSHDWVPPLMLHWRMVAGDPGKLAPFLRRLDRLAYGLRLLGIGLDKRATRYRALIEAIRAGVPEGPGHPLDLTRDELRLLAHNLRALHTRSQLACKLVLMRLNDVLAGSPQALEPGDLSVEHVLPQKPGRNSQWRQWFPVADERERLTQSLGNLILVSRHKNEEARNLDFVQKREVYFGEGAARLPLITRDLAGLSEWRPEDVRRREARMVEALDTLWDIGARRALSRPSEAPVATERLRPRPIKPRPLTSTAQVRR